MEACGARHPTAAQLDRGAIPALGETAGGGVEDREPRGVPGGPPQGGEQCSERVQWQWVTTVCGGGVGCVVRC